MQLPSRPGSAHRSRVKADGSAVDVGSMERTSSEDSATTRCLTFTRLSDDLNRAGVELIRMGSPRRWRARATLAGLRSRCAAGRHCRLLHDAVRLGLFTCPQIGLLTARILGFARLFFRYTGFGPGRDG